MPRRDGRGRYEERDNGRNVKVSDEPSREKKQVN